MIRYTPFLKAKRGELTAMGELSPEVKQAICPFFDFPRKKPEYTADTYATTTRNIVSSLKKHWGTDLEFYFDDLDIAQNLTVDGQQQYAYVLAALKDLHVIPVVALDRTTHNSAVDHLKRSGEVTASCVAFRADHSSFEDFDDSADQIDYDLANVFSQFEAIDLILDCQVCNGLNFSQTAQEIATFTQKFCEGYDKVRRVVVTGSSIPGSLGEVVDSSTTEILVRGELSILSKARALTDIHLTCGDYTTVSPFYSDAEFDPKLFPKVTSPRLIYSYNHSHYVARGSSLASGGYGQYYGITRTLCGQEFFRGRTYSTGEDYFYEKSRGIGKNATNGTVVKPSVVAHVTYMVRHATL